MSRKRNRRLERQGVRTVDGEKLYRLSTIAEAADLTLRTVQRHVEKGLLPVKRVGPYGLPRVKESEMRKYLDEVKEPPKGG
jgi:hypothetical protein